MNNDTEKNRIATIEASRWLHRVRRVLVVRQWHQRTKLHAASACCFVIAVVLLGLGIGSLLGQAAQYSRFKLTTCDIVTATDSQQYFSLDIRLGSQLSYLQARIIGVLWDLVIGQGGRFVQGWLLYKTSIDALVFLTESLCVPYDVYTSITLLPGSLDSLWSLLRLLSKRRSYKIVLTAIWLLWSTIHVLGFPTLWSAAAGYINLSEPNFRMPDGAVVNLTSSQLSYCYTCIDCSRIGLEDDMTLLSDSFGELDPANSLSYSAAFGGLGNTPSQEYALKSVYYHSALYAHDKGNLAQFVYYSQAAHILLNDAFNSANLHQFPMFPTGYTQALNHGPHQLPWLFNDSITENPGVIPYNSSISINNKTYSVDAPLLRFSNPTAAKLSSRATSGFSIGIEYSSETSILCYNGEVLPSGWLEASTGNLLCIGQAGYTWGLSSTIVLTGLSLQLIWVLGLYVVWLNANLRSKLCKSRRKFDGVYRIAADLIGAMQADLGTDLSSYDNKMFKQELAKCGDIGWFINEEDSEDASDAVLSSKATYREFEKRGKQF